MRAAARTGALIGVLSAGAIVALNCASATTITLEVRGDDDICGSITQTGIVVTSPDDVDDTEKYPLLEFEDSCNGGKIGTLVITPHSSTASDRVARVAVRIVTGLNGKTATQCDNPKGEVEKDCLITKRVTQFQEGVNVPLPVVLSSKCVHVTCKTGYECDPRGESATCIPRASASSSSSGGPEEDAAVDPIDGGHEEPDADAEPPVKGPKEICERGTTSRVYSLANNSCTITCEGEACKVPDLCPPDQNCIVICKGGACKNVNCATALNCKFSCDSPNANCENISCDAGNCELACASTKNNCNGATLVGKTNKTTCKLVSDGQGNVSASCDSIRCVPGLAGDPKPTCERDCDNDEFEGCGKKYACDAGDCSKFEPDAGSTIP